MKYIVQTHWGKRGKYDPVICDHNAPFAHWYRIIRDILRVHAPERVPEIESLLASYELYGGGAQLHQDLKEQYGDFFEGVRKGKEAGQANAQVKKKVILKPRVECRQISKPKIPTMQMCLRLPNQKANPECRGVTNWLT